MATYFTDFSSTDVGDTPDGWVDYDAENFPSTFEVMEDPDDRKMAVHARGIDTDNTSTNSRIHAFVWNDVPSVSDVEIFMLFRIRQGFDNWHRKCIAYMRLTGTDDDATAYGAAMFQDGNTGNHRLLWARPNISSWNSTASVTDSPEDFEVDDVWALRAQIIGTNCRARWWIPADPHGDPVDDEPTEWNIDSTVTDFAGPGKVGLGGITLNPLQFDMGVYRFGVGTEGDPAPAEAELTNPLDTPTNFSFTEDATERKVTGSWSAVNDANSYDWEVQVDVSETETPDWQPFDDGSVSGTSFELDDSDGIDWETSYRARVRANPESL